MNVEKEKVKSRKNLSYLVIISTHAPDYVIDKLENYPLNYTSE